MELFSQREHPLALKILLNVSGPLGLGLAMLGYVSPRLGLFFTAVGVLYVAWELYPAALRIRKGRPAMSLLVFVGAGALLGFFIWLLLPRIKSSVLGSGRQSSDRQAPFAFAESLPDKVTIILGSPAASRFEVVLKTATLEKEKYTGLLDLNGDRPITAYIRDGTFYVDATVRDMSGNKVVRIRKNKVEVMPAGWDMNFSTNAVEVVNASQRPVFQMIRKRANVIQIAGIFVGKDGGAFDAQPVKKLFRYPSWEFRGQFAQEKRNTPAEKLAMSRYSRMTDAELRSQVQALCAKISILGREWNRAYASNNERAIRAMNSAKSDAEKEAYGNQRVADNEREYRLLETTFDKDYRDKANLLRAEISRRVEAPPDLLGTETAIPPLLQTGVAAGSNPWNDVCEYLEALARRLH